MNKRTLKSYLKKSNRPYLEQNCFKYDNGMGYSMDYWRKDTKVEI